MLPDLLCARLSDSLMKVLRVFRIPSTPEPTCYLVQVSWYLYAYVYTAHMRIIPLLVVRN